jgi:hypothetical protein
MGEKQITYEYDDDNLSAADETIFLPSRFYVTSPL